MIIFSDSLNSENLFAWCYFNWLEIYKCTLRSTSGNSLLHAWMQSSSQKIAFKHETDCCYYWVLTAMYIYIYTNLFEHVNKYIHVCTFVLYLCIHWYKYIQRHTHMNAFVYKLSVHTYAFKHQYVTVILVHKRINNWHNNETLNLYWFHFMPGRKGMFDMILIKKNTVFMTLAVGAL